MEKSVRDGGILERDREREEKKRQRERERETERERERESLERTRDLGREDWERGVGREGL